MPESAAQMSDTALYALLIGSGALDSATPESELNAALQRIVDSEATEVPA
jgi:hypothetical protein